MSDLKNIFHNCLDVIVENDIYFPVRFTDKLFRFYESTGVAQFPERAVQTAGITMEFCTSQEAVSYTHLDVYKRQAQGQHFLTYAYNILNEVNRAKLSLEDESELTNPLHIGTIESLSLIHIYLKWSCCRKDRRCPGVITISPLVGSSCPDKIFKKVDLPAPLAPIMP